MISKKAPISTAPQTGWWRHEKSIASIFGGEYETILVDGSGKLKGDTVAKKVIVNGIFKGKGKLLTDELQIDGIARAFREIKAKKVVIEGLLKLRRASLKADQIRCDGIMIVNREVCADQIFLDGLCSVAKMYGDEILLKHNVNNLNLSGKRSAMWLTPFCELYFGRKVSMDYSLVDLLECTDLEAEGVKFKVIRANKVRLKGGCVVELVCIIIMMLAIVSALLSNIFNKVITSAQKKGL